MKFDLQTHRKILIKNSIMYIKTLVILLFYIGGKKMGDYWFYILLRDKYIFLSLN